jgi:large subunit ribosomal protein L23
MEILQKPIITEKMSAKGETLRQYGFIVEKTATKDAIKKAVEQFYNVSVVSVNTMISAGKRKSRNTKAGLITGRKKTVKKAIVTLKDGDVIDFYSNI